MHHEDPRRASNCSQRNVEGQAEEHSHGISVYEYEPRMQASMECMEIGRNKNELNRNKPTRN